MESCAIGDRGLDIANDVEGTKCRLLDVRPSACVPPGVRVKLSLMNEGILGRFAAGSAGRKRMRWSRALCGSLVGAIARGFWFKEMVSKVLKSG